MAVGSTQYDTLKRKAYKLVKEAIERGELPSAKSLQCADCGKAAQCYDHRDYTKPLQVEAVCRGCNNKRGPSINAPADVGQGHALKNVWRNPKYKPEGRDRLYEEEKAADFPGHCVINLDENLIECYEITARHEKDPDVNSYFDEVIRAHRAKILRKKQSANEQNIFFPEKGLVNGSQQG